MSGKSHENLVCLNGVAEFDPAVKKTVAKFHRGLVRFSANRKNRPSSKALRTAFRQQTLCQHSPVKFHRMTETRFQFIIGDNDRLAKHSPVFRSADVKRVGKESYIGEGQVVLAAVRAAPNLAPSRKETYRFPGIILQFLQVPLSRISSRFRLNLKYRPFWGRPCARYCAFRGS